MVDSSPTPQIIVSEILSAEKNIRKYIRKTPLEPSYFLSSLSKSSVYLKLENMQHTGSFKTRGAFNKLLALSPKQLEKGIITASTGNHGMATSFALKTLERGKGTIFLPETASKAKINRLKQFNISLEFYGKDSEETESFARKKAEKENYIFVSPYNDIKIIAGQGTIGFELVKQLNDINYVFITIGGGGLASGIAAYLKAIKKDIKIIGCLPENSPVMSESIKANKIITMESKPTISDGSAGGIEENAITFDLCKKLIDEYILVSEDEIKSAMNLIFKHHGLVVEGSAGVAVSAFIKEKHNYNGNVVIIICGGNINIDEFLSIVCK
ncbi:MAG: threonine/serine dehydratase [Candidatus Hodarchaeales archaeon]